MTAVAEPAAHEPKVDWVLDDAAQARIAAELAAIDKLHEGYPRCVVCDQRCIRLDKYGCCSKVSERSEPHRIHREEMRSGGRS